MFVDNLWLFLFVLINTKKNAIHLLSINKNPYLCNSTIQTCGCSSNPPIFIQTARIIGGEQVTLSQSWPWMVSIRKWGHHVCGGVIISSSFILTAAHCIPSTGLSVAIGIIQQSNLTIQDNRIRAIANVYSHINWNAEKMHNDLAILHLEHPLHGQLFNKICLPSKSGSIGIGSEVIAIGFGRVKESSIRSSDILRQIKLRILSHTSQSCQNELTDIDTQICAGLEVSGQGE
jgi:secreted trypsin-like serine protease